MAEQPAIALGEATLEQMERQRFPRPAAPTMDLPEEQHRFWLSLIEEEYEELRAASEERDLLAFADGLGDLVYVAYLTAWSHGIDLDRVIGEIHRSNLTKDRPTSDGGKSVKGPHFVAADIARALGLRAQ
jgi:NTP pyrophosphatase (non-canonical NTP hydrolase)